MCAGVPAEADVLVNEWFGHILLPVHTNDQEPDVLMPESMHETPDESADRMDADCETDRTHSRGSPPDLLTGAGTCDSSKEPPVAQNAQRNERDVEMQDTVVSTSTSERIEGRAEQLVCRCATGI